MNEKLNYNEIEVGQSSKGVWYCKSITVSESYGGTIIENVESLMKGIEAVLKLYNEPEKPEKKEAA